ncbi:hypothetical protein GCM10010389_26090 [Streptomyces echinoruber]|uniref:Uncharacterized protein n=1 Tax=Streptomyces echinoruber TaxID=68898 RepID=A0A918R6G6_9ACTN|nr:hypothetical protein GCM10010389_26090 [Streptomyces echinoruber]
MGEEFDGVDVGEGAVRLALADGGADCFDDDCVTHARASLAAETMTRPPQRRPLRRAVAGNGVITSE